MKIFQSLNLVRFLDSFWILLAVLGAFTLARGLFHAFIPDSGAGTVAHLDLTTNAQNIIFLIAVIGIHQVAIGLFQLIIAFRLRSFVAHAFVIHFIMLILPKFFDKPPASVFPGLLVHDVELWIVSIVIFLFFLSKCRKPNLP